MDMIQPSRIGLTPALILALGVALTGCATPPAHDNNFDSVVLRPGDSRICTGSPCEVFLRTPKGKKDWLISGQNVYPGRYPPGKTAYLGRFEPGSYSFQIQDSKSPTSYLHVAGHEHE
ncbi:MAG: hypothetical protein H7842_08400 [Gammaproteobacteria bacterium SHHR-1]|uniref:hypothetical protein n=1 Tax=Magnetovirga frankeli TaxID=947516 RepID=UPI0012940DDF|nr:hypothetical protein D5125_14195 [gamma proteobacterium SS-5]